MIFKKISNYIFFSLTGVQPTDNWNHQQICAAVTTLEFFKFFLPIATMLFDLLTWVFCLTSDHHVYGDNLEADALTTFISQGSLASATSSVVAAYHKPTNTAWLLGGVACSTCVYSFDLATGILTAHTSLINGISNGNTATMIGDILYYYSTNYGSLCSYNTQTNVENFAFSDTPVDLSYPCMTANPDDGADANKLYVVGDSSGGSNALYIYDIEGDYWETSRTTSNYHYSPFCEISNNNYLYVKGQYSNRIEKINIDTLDSFVSLSGFYGYYNIRGSVSVRIENLIYFIGGFNDYYLQNTPISSVYSINTVNDEVTLSDVSFLTSYANGIVTNDNRICIAGGVYAGTNSRTDAIVCSNQIAPIVSTTATPTTTTTTTTRTTVGTTMVNSELLAVNTTQDAYVPTMIQSTTNNNDDQEAATGSRSSTYVLALEIICGVLVVGILVLFVYHKTKLRNKSQVDNHNSTVVNPNTNVNDQQEMKVADSNEIKVETHNSTQVATGINDYTRAKSHTLEGNQVKNVFINPDFETNPFEIDQENDNIIYTTK